MNFSDMRRRKIGVRGGSYCLISCKGGSHKGEREVLGSGGLTYNKGLREDNRSKRDRFLLLDLWRCWIGDSEDNGRVVWFEGKVSLKWAKDHLAVFLKLSVDVVEVEEWISLFQFGRSDPWRIASIVENVLLQTQ